MALRGAGLCLRAGAWVGQLGAGVPGRGPADYRPASQRRHHPGCRVPVKPLRTANGGDLAVRQGAGFEICCSG